MATLQNIGKLKYRGKDGQWHPLPVVVQDTGGGVSTISGKGAPTSETQGKMNQLYRDEDTQKLYICTATDGGYTWAEVSGGGSVDIDATLTKAGQAADAKAAGDAIGKKIDKAQGTGNAGKILGIGADGNVTPQDKPVQALAGAAAPTTATAGVFGQEYYVIANGEVTEMYVCTAVANGTYTWGKVDMPEQVQADWAQNDSTAADYVQNRPGGYYGDPVTVDEEIYSGEINDVQMDIYTDAGFTLVIGQTYKVTIGDAEKTYTAFADSFGGIDCVTIGDGKMAEVMESSEMFGLVYAAIEGQGSAAIVVCPVADVGKTIRVTQFGTAREVHKIPAEFLDIPPVEQEPQVITVTLEERDGKQYGSLSFNEVLATQRGGKEVRLLDNNGHYYQFTGIYNAGERIDFHSFWHYTLWWAVMYTDNLIEFSEYNIGQQELTYDVTNSYTTIDDSKDIQLRVGGTSTRMKLFVTIRLISTTAGAYVQLRYYKGTKTLKLFGHENIGTTKATLYIELEKTKTNDTTFLTTLRLLNEDGTLHAANYYFSGELDLNDGDTTYPSPKIEIISGTEDKFEARQNVRKYYR